MNLPPEDIVTLVLAAFTIGGGGLLLGRYGRNGKNGNASVEVLKLELSESYRKQTDRMLEALHRNELAIREGNAVLMNLTQRMQDDHARIEGRIEEMTR